MHRLHGVERDCEVAGVLDIDHQLGPAAWRDLANGTELFAAVRHERLESHLNLLLHDFLSRNLVIPRTSTGGLWPLSLLVGVNQSLMNASRSALIVSACVVGMPCGKPL